jgi:siroheme synthase (precorrin-2 oxidase/ferrochelatase)
MQKQKNGKRYDTTTASFLTITKWKGNASAVYLKRTGEIFMENLDTNELVILNSKEQEQARTIESIKKRIEEVLDFSLSEKIQINPFIRETTKKRLEELEAVLRLSASEIVDNAILNEFKDYTEKKAERIKALESIRARIERKS